MIAQDLDQAQFVADSLQHLLEERERVLNDELGNADMSNQMICEWFEKRERMKPIDLITCKKIQDHS